jgi:hypothetical protein
VRIGVAFALILGGCVLASAARAEGEGTAAAQAGETAVAAEGGAGLAAGAIADAGQVPADQA